MQAYNDHFSTTKLVLINDSWLIKNGLLLLLSEYFSEIVLYENVHSFEISINNQSKNSQYLIIADSKESSKIKRLLDKVNSSNLIISLVTERYYNVVSENEFIISIYDTRDDIIETLQRSLDFLKNSVNDDIQTVLSSREIDILRLVSKGDSSQQIATKLNISFNTVNTHRKNIASKLGIKTASGQTAYAIINNLIKLDDTTLS
jgi:DNA-binding NarL/FixJ family response regulator